MTKILVLRYLTEGGAAPSTGKFLTYREIPWGEVYFKQFQGRCLFRLAFGFGGKLDAFREIMERVGAQAISSGDVGYELEFMKGSFCTTDFMGQGDDVVSAVRADPLFGQFPGCIYAGRGYGGCGRCHN